MGIAIIHFLRLVWRLVGIVPFVQVQRHRFAFTTAAGTSWAMAASIISLECRCMWSHVWLFSSNRPPNRTCFMFYSKSLELRRLICPSWWMRFTCLYNWHIFIGIGYQYFAVSRLIFCFTRGSASCFAWAGPRCWLLGYLEVVRVVFYAGHCRRYICQMENC